MIEQAIDWISVNYIEVIGAILGVVYIFFSIRQNIFTWPTGLLTSALYVYVFFVSKFYADMGFTVLLRFCQYLWLVLLVKRSPKERGKTSYRIQDYFEIMLETKLL